MGSGEENEDGEEDGEDEEDDAEYIEGCTVLDCVDRGRLYDCRRCTCCDSYPSSSNSSSSSSAKFDTLLPRLLLALLPKVETGK